MDGVGSKLVHHSGKAGHVTSKAPELRRYRWYVSGTKVDIQLNTLRVHLNYIHYHTHNDT